MADIGQLTMEKGALFGRVRTLSHRLMIELEPIEAGDKRGEGSPDFTCYARDAGELIAIGSAWWKVTERPRAAPLRWLSLTLDDPSFPSALNVAAFPSDDDATLFRIVWNRPRMQNREAA